MFMFVFLTSGWNKQTGWDTMVHAVLGNIFLIRDNIEETNGRHKEWI